MDAQLNPTTGDYTGSRISHLGNAVYLRLCTHLGAWWADKTLGSRTMGAASCLSRLWTPRVHPTPLSILWSWGDSYALRYPQF